MKCIRHVFGVIAMLSCGTAALANDAFPDRAAFVAQGAKQMTSDDLLSTLVGNSQLLTTGGGGVYFTPDGKKVSRAGQFVPWRISDTGAFCEVRFADGKEACVGDADYWTSYHLNGLYRSFRADGKLLFEWRVVSGNAFQK